MVPVRHRGEGDGGGRREREKERGSEAILCVCVRVWALARLLPRVVAVLCVAGWPTASGLVVVGDLSC